MLNSQYKSETAVPRYAGCFGVFFSWRNRAYLKDINMQMYCISIEVHLLLFFETRFIRVCRWNFNFQFLLPVFYTSKFILQTFISSQRKWTRYEIILLKKKKRRRRNIYKMVLVFRVNEIKNLLHFKIVSGKQSQWKQIDTQTRLWRKIHSWPIQLRPCSVWDTYQNMLNKLSTSFWRPKVRY